MSNNSDLANETLLSPKQKCGNCGHDIMIYGHVLSSELLIFHDKNGVFSRSCRCGCKCSRKNDKENISR